MKVKLEGSKNIFSQKTQNRQSVGVKNNFCRRNVEWSALAHVDFELAFQEGQSDEQTKTASQDSGFSSDQEPSKTGPLLSR